jgi:hypothetical protein
MKDQTMKDQTMNASKQITGLIGLLIAFILLTVYIALTSAAPIWVETAQMLSNVSSLQFHVMVDIYLLVLLFCIWMIKDSRQQGYSIQIQIMFVLLSVSLISIGVMSYLIYRAKSQRNILDSLT